MAIWLSALTRIPWNTLITQAPAILEGAIGLLNAIPRSQGKRAPNKSNEDTVQQLQRRLDSFEASYLQNAEIVTQIADQLQTVTSTLQVLGARLKLLLSLSLAGLMLGLIALAVALFA